MGKRASKANYWQDAPLPRDQLVLIPETLESCIPEDHPVRLLDEILSQLDWSAWEAEYHGRAGQPPIHPSVLAKVLLFALIRRIRSSRQIEYHLKHSIDFIWLASGRTIDHTTLSEFRRKHPQRLKEFYRQVVQLALRLGVAKLAEVCIDGTRVLANASRFKTLKAAKVEQLLAELDRQIGEAMRAWETSDTLEELFERGEGADHLPLELRERKARQEQLRQTLEQLREMETQRKQDGIDPRKHPAQLPTTDPESRILPNKEGGYAPNYTPMAVVETEHGFIVGADVLIGNVEHLVLSPMIDALEQDYGQRPNSVLGDGAYSTGPNLTAMEQAGIELLAPLPDAEPPDNPALRADLTQPVAAEQLDRLPRNPQTKCFAKEAFVYEEQTDSFYCPAGKRLPREGVEQRQRGGGTLELISYRGRDCAGCPLGARCRKTPAARAGRKVTRDGYEAIRRRHRERMRTDAAKTRYKRRQHYGETPFAVLKAVLNLRRFLLRGIAGVKQEWLWACTALNLKKLASLWAGLRARQFETAIRQTP